MMASYLALLSSKNHFVQSSICLIALVVMVSLLPTSAFAHQWDILSPTDANALPAIETTAVPFETATITKPSNLSPDQLATAYKRLLVQNHALFEASTRLNYQLKNEAPTGKTLTTSRYNQLKQTVEQLKRQQQSFMQQATELDNQLGANSGSAPQLRTITVLQTRITEQLTSSTRHLNGVHVTHTSQPMGGNMGSKKQASTQASVVASTPYDKPATTKELTTLKDAMSYLKKLKQSLEALASNDVTSDAPATLALKTKLEDANQALEQALGTITEQNNRISNLSNKIETLQTLQIKQDALQPVNLSGAATTASANTPALQQELEMLKEQLQAYQATIQQLKTKLQASTAVTGGVSTTPKGAPVGGAITPQSATLKPSPALTEAAAAYQAGLKLEATLTPTPETLQNTLNHYQQALQLNPQSALYQLAVAKTLCQQEAFTTAQPLLESLQQHAALQGATAPLLGRVYLAQQHPVEALKQYSQHVSSDTLSNMAILYKQQNQLTIAEPLLKAAIALTPADAQLHYNLGNLYLQKQDQPHALKAYAKAYELNPTYTNAIYNLALLEVQTGQKTKAKEHLNTYLKLTPAESDNRQQIEALVKTL
jgi:Tfp pilus assembly protein PilF/predicted  nucleic acid-binding Zn-ribbon protein